LALTTVVLTRGVEGMSGDPEKIRAEVLRQLDEEDATAAEIESMGKQYFRAAREVRDTVKPMRDAIVNLPSEALTTGPMVQFSQGLTGWHNIADKVKQTITLCNSFGAACSGVTNTSNTTMVTLVSCYSSPALTQAKERLFVAQKPAELAEKAKASLTRLGLQTRLLDEAMGAMASPVHGEGGTVSVTLALRQCIENAVLAELLPRRPKQEKAGRAGDKVRSIGEQCNRPMLAPDHFARLANEAGPLLDQLSGTKDKALSRDDIRELLIRGLTFLNAFLDGIDENRLRS